MKKKQIYEKYLFKYYQTTTYEIFSFIDEFKDEKNFFEGDFSKFRFKTDDNLVYDEKINIPVCVISLSSVIKKDWIHIPIFKLQKCLYESLS